MKEEWRHVMLWFRFIYIIYELLFIVHYLKEALFILENGRYA